MAGYTRQATANIVTGAVIDAADFNSEYNAIEAAFNASSGHAHDGTTGNGPPISNLGPAQDFVVTSSVVRPKVTNTYDFGTSSIEWKDGFFDGTLRTDILTVDETSTFTGNVTTVADVAIGGNLTVTGNATINGNLTFGDADTDTVSFGAEIDSSIIPDDDDTFDLGSSTKQWRNLFIDGTANIDSLVADTADINGGTIDAAVIGGNTAAAITATTINASGTITGNVVGDLQGDVTGNVSGNAGTATVLASARTIGGVSFNGSANIDLPGVNTAGNQDTTGNAATATSLANTRSIALGGDLSGSANFNGSADISINATIANDSVALGTNTTGNYAASVAAGNGISVTGSAGEGTSFTVAHAATNPNTSGMNNSGRTYIQDITVDSFGHVTAVATATETVTNANNASITISGGDGLSGSGIFTTNQSINETITLNLSTNQKFSDSTTVQVGNNDENITFSPSNSGTMSFRTDGNEHMRLTSGADLHVDGDVIGFSTLISDKRLKHDIEKIDSALDKVSELNGYTFSYNKNGKRAAGVIAQEVEKVLPSAVENKSLVFHTGEEGVEYKTVKYDQLHGLLIEAIKELKQKLDECKCKKCECE